MTMTSLGVISVLFYLLAYIGQWLRLRQVKRLSQSWVNITLIVALMTHAATCYALMYGTGDINLSVFNIASLVALAIIALTLVVGIYEPTHSLYLLLLPLVVIALFLSLVLRHDQQFYVLNGPLLLHILFSILSYSFMTLAACQALLIAYQDAQLKKHHLRFVIRVFPPLQVMEKLLFALLWAGLILLSIALVTGFLILKDVYTQEILQRVVLSLFAWCVFVALLCGRHFLGWRGKTATRYTILGFILLIMAYFGNKFILHLF